MRHMHIWVGHGDLSGEWCLHTLIWINVLDMMVGTIGAIVKMKEVLAFMSTGIYYCYACCDSYFDDFVH